MSSEYILIKLMVLNTVVASEIIYWVTAFPSVVFLLLFNKSIDIIFSSQDMDFQCRVFFVLSLSEGERWLLFVVIFVELLTITVQTFFPQYLWNKQWLYLQCSIYCTMKHTYYNIRVIWYAGLTRMFIAIIICRLCSGKRGWNSLFI